LPGPAVKAYSIAPGILAGKGMGKDGREGDGRGGSGREGEGRGELRRTGEVMKRRWMDEPRCEIIRTLPVVIIQC